MFTWFTSVECDKMYDWYDLYGCMVWNQSNSSAWLSQTPLTVTLLDAQCITISSASSRSNDGTEGNQPGKHEDEDEDFDWNGDDKSSPTGEQPDRVGGDEFAKSKTAGEAPCYRLAIWQIGVF